MRISDWSSDVCSSDLTERPFTSPLNDEHRAGTFACAGCALPLYSSKTKFESHTGWPSFWAPLKGADRKSVGSGKSVSVSVDLGGRRIIKQKQKRKYTRT